MKTIFLVFIKNLAENCLKVGVDLISERMTARLFVTGVSEEIADPWLVQYCEQMIVIIIIVFI